MQLSRVFAIAGVLLLSLLDSSSALQLARAGASHVTPARSYVAASLRMQVEAPIKIPDSFNPAFAPAEPKGAVKNSPGKKFKLLLFNDNVNRREYVAKVLMSNVPGLTQADAYLVMQKAHKNGMAVVGIWVFELAEAYCDALKSNGLISSVEEDEDD